MRYNNGDMDDLFKRASEGYPLRTDSADWDRLASALDGEPASSSDQEKRRRRRGIFWWFLLIPMAGVGYLTWQARTHHASEKAVVAAGSDGRAGAARVAGNGSGENGVSGDKIVRNMRNPGDSGVNIAATQSAILPDGQHVAGTPGTDNGVSGGGKVRNLRTASSYKSGEEGVGDGSGKQVAANRTDAAEWSGTGSAGSSTGATMTTAGRRLTDNGAGVDHELVLALLDLHRAPIGGGYHVDVDVVAPKAAADSPAPAAKKQNKKTSHGYIGVLGAPDFSTVHFQSMKGVGTTFGVLLGYSFNDRWAVETGLSLDRKRYYTAGEYFSTEKVTIPTGYTKLLNVDGTCNMWEIPVNVRYNFSTSPRMKWFATAGLSTYLMTSENYTYQVQNNWNTEDSNWNIHKPSQYWFSIINLSVGYEQRIGKIGKLRLEPYVRIPLSGIGTGNLPILSAGLNIGFTRQLW
jgi:hypothetical protein